MGTTDVGYERRPPEGCVCVEDRVLNMAGLRILGLGGSPLYNGGAHQYTEKADAAAHQPPAVEALPRRGRGSRIDPRPPCGATATPTTWHTGASRRFSPLLDKYKPRYLIHGHVHMSYGVNLPRIHQYARRRFSTAVSATSWSFPNTKPPAS